MKITREKNKGITLIALVITIILLLILAGITITQLTGSGLFRNAKKAKEISDYTSAKEIVQMKLMEIQVECIKEERDYTIVEIAQSMALDEGITIEKYYNSNTESIKTGVTENLVDLKGIVVSVNQYSKYKFLIGESCEIEGVTIEKITDTFGKENFKPVEEFEREILGITPGTGGSDDEEDKDNPQEGTVDVPGVGDNVDISNPIEITTYMAIKNNSKNTLNLAEVENAEYLLESKTNNVDLLGNIVVANSKADSIDKIEVQITGTYKGQNYTNHLIVYVEPKNTTIIETQEYFLIYNLADLERFRDLINHKIAKTENAKLMSDIIMNEGDFIVSESSSQIQFIEGVYFWEPIANKPDVDSYGIPINTSKNSYNGIFDGNNHEIKGMCIKKVKNDTLEGLIYAGGGLIGTASNKSVIKNLKINNSYIFVSGNDYMYAGAIVGISFGDIINCHNLGGRIIGDTCVGGISGAIVCEENSDNKKGISQCSNLAKVSGGYYVGGISGAHNYSEINESYNLGVISNINSYGTFISGISNVNGGKIENCYNAGDVTGKDVVGGISSILYKRC